MRVKLFVPVACPAGSFQTGAQVELPDAIAMGLINGGYAEALDVAVKPAPAEETLVVEPKTETPKKRRARRK